MSTPPAEYLPSKILGRNIEVLLKAKGVSLTEFAAKIEVNATNAHRLRTGARTQYNLKLLLKLSEMFDLPVDTLIKPMPNVSYGNNE